MIKHVPYTAHDERKRSGLRVTVDVTRVIHGTYYGRTAVFVGLTVAHMDRKVPQTKVRIDVSPGGLGNVEYDDYVQDPSIHQPIIVRFAPKKHYGAATSVDKSQEIGGEGKLAAPAPISGSGITASVKRTTSYALEKRQIITAHTSSEARQSTKTILELEALENSVTNDGIYDQLPLGIIIESRNKPIVLTVDVEPKQSVFNSTFRYVASSYHYTVPVYIDKEDWGADGLPEGCTREMEKWDNTIWRELVSYSEESVSWTRIGLWLKLCL
jgi:hypothetical protein